MMVKFGITTTALIRWFDKTSPKINESMARI